MGLGKTVEVLACVLTHKPACATEPQQLSERIANLPKAPRAECVPCSTYSHADDPNLPGHDKLWVECSGCLAWMHASCVGFGGMRPIPDTVLCAMCLRALAAAEVPGVSKATLIVCPEAIERQWLAEIQRHTAPGALKVVVYTGQSSSITSNAQGTVVTAAHLAAADVVLTTYDCLRHDVNFEAETARADGGSSSSGRVLRAARKYPVMPTPLTRLTWWRVVLDEAQQIEGGATKAAAMAAALRSVHRWCVTGTPVTRGLADIYGLLRFLQAPPWADRVVWTRAVQAPLEVGSGAAFRALLGALCPAAGGLMWRHTKSQVAADLGIPAQVSEVRRLELSEIERHYYKRCHRETADKARELLPARVLTAVASGCALEADADRPLTHAEADALFPRLVRLRQACCHPQVGRQGGIAAARRPKTMDEVLAELVERDRGEAEDAQRALVATTCGLAALALLRGAPVAAAARYREVLVAAAEHAGICEVDRLQRIHAMTNLGELLGKEGKGIAVELGERDLAVRAAAMRDAYLAESRGALVLADAEFSGALERLAEKARAAADPDMHQGSWPPQRNVEVAAHCEKMNSWWEYYGVRLTEAIERDNVRLAAERAAAEKVAAERAAREAAEAAERAAAERAALVAAGLDPDAELERRAAEATERRQRQRLARKRAERWDAGSDVSSDESEEGDGEEEQEEEEEAPPEVAELDVGLEQRLLRHVDEALAAADGGYQAAAGRNALSLVGRLDSIHAALRRLSQHFRNLWQLQADVLRELVVLRSDCREPSETLCAAAGACERCRGTEGTEGVVCRPCLTEERLVRWECKLFQLDARALRAGQPLSEEDALDHYWHQLVLRRQADGADGDGTPPAAAGQWKHRGKLVSSTTMTHRDNEHSLVLSALLSILRRPEQFGAPAVSGEERERLSELAHCHDAFLRQSQALFFKARQLTLKQRQLLLAHDELSMCVSRLQLEPPGGASALGNRALLFVRPDEVAYREQEMEGERAAAAADFSRAFGQLKYALNLQKARSLITAGAVVPAGTAEVAARRSGESAGVGASVAPLVASAAEAAKVARAPAGRGEPVAVAAAEEAGLSGFVAQATGHPLEPAAACPGLLAPSEQPRAGPAEVGDNDSDCVVVPAAPARAAAALGPRHGAEAVPSWQDSRGPAATGAKPPVATTHVGATLEEECPVCNEPLADECMMARCGHQWCRDCHSKMLRLWARLRCPLCNLPLATQEVSRVALRPCAPSPAEDAQPGGSYGGKIEAVVHEARRTLAERPDDKILIFSTWLDVLELLAHALAEHRVPCLLGKGRVGLQRALAHFCAPSAAGPSLEDADVRREATVSGGAAAPAGAPSAAGSGARAAAATAARVRAAASRGRAARWARGEARPRVLLLLLKQASAGLNLTEAQHAFLVEPSTNAGVEAQAVARIHRMNQARETRVVRFVTNDTVEAVLHRLTSSKAAAMSAAALTKRGASEPPLMLAHVAKMLFDPQHGV